MLIRFDDSFITCRGHSSRPLESDFCFIFEPCMYLHIALAIAPGRFGVGTGFPRFHCAPGDAQKQASRVAKRHVLMSASPVFQIPIHSCTPPSIRLALLHRGTGSRATSGTVCLLAGFGVGRRDTFPLVAFSHAFALHFLFTFLFSDRRQIDKYGETPMLHSDAVYCVLG